MPHKIITALLVSLLISSCAPGVFQSMNEAEYKYNIGESTDIDLLIDVLSANNENSKNAALALGRLGDKRATKYLAEMIRIDGAASTESIIAIEMINDLRAVPDLIQVVKLNRRDAETAINVLGNFKDQRAIPILVKVVEEDRPYAKAAIEALGKIGDKSAVEMLMSKLRQPPEVLRDDVKLRVVKDTDNKKHTLTFDLPDNLVPVIQITEMDLRPEGTAVFKYLLKDSEFDSLNIKAEYTTDGGRTWNQASVRNLKNIIYENEYQNELIWDLRNEPDLQDYLNDFPEGVQFKLTPFDSHTINKPGPESTGVPAFWHFRVDTTTVQIKELAEEVSGDVSIKFLYPNYTEASLDSFVYQYSYDYGGSWLDAEVIMDISQVTQSQDTMYINWASDIDLPNTDLEDVLFRVSSYKGNKIGTLDISEPFHLDNNVIPSAEFLDFHEDENGIFLVGYRIMDEESDNISLSLQYSTDDRRSWKQATVSGNLTGITPDQYTDEIKWYADFDIKDMREDLVTLRIRPFDLDPGLFTDSRPFFLKDYNYTKLTQGDQSGRLELSLSSALEDSTVQKVEYSPDGGRTWYEATIEEAIAIRKGSKNQLRFMWRADQDIASYLGQVEEIFKVLDDFKEPSVVPELLLMARNKNSNIRKERELAKEATRLLDKESDWIIDGLISSLILDDQITSNEALIRLRPLDDPKVIRAIADYEYYLSQQPKYAEEFGSELEEMETQLYEESLRETKVLTDEQLIANIKRLWDNDEAAVETFLKEIGVLRELEKLKEDYEADKLNVTYIEYQRMRDKILLDAEKRRIKERDERLKKKKSGGGGY
ncbi:HEAT repeat domain-containing protein [candidate division KSB1 bacterium]